jgi:cation transport ATPase
MGEREAGITGRRRFRLIDAVVLVATAALMLSTGRLVRWFWAWATPVSSFGTWETRWMAWSLALAALGLAPSLYVLASPAARRGLRSGAPGLLVPAVIAAVLAVRACIWLAQGQIAKAFEGRPGFYRPEWSLLVMNYLRDDFRGEVAVGIAASWLALAIVGRWNPEPAWDDRLGRFAGALWFAFALGAPLVPFVP